jgi:hypothetical protein
MNKLSAGQKSILTQVLGAYRDIYTYDDLPDGIKLDLNTINDFETITDAVNRFIWDYNTERAIAGRLSIKGGR